MLVSFSKLCRNRFWRILPICYCRFHFRALPESILKNFADSLLPVSFPSFARIDFEEFCRFVLVFQALPGSILKIFADSLLPVSFSRLCQNRFWRFLPIRYCRFRFRALPESILKNFADSLLPVSFSELCQNRFWRILPLRYCRFRFPSFAGIDFEGFCRFVTAGFVFRALPDSVFNA